MFKSNKFLAIIISFLFVVAMGSCGGGGSKGSGAGGSEVTDGGEDGGGGGEVATTTIIEPEGGTATSSDGNLKIEIPAGAIAEDVVVSITKASFPEAGVDESIALSEPYRLKIELKSDSQSLKALGQATISNKTLAEIGTGIIKVTFTNVSSATNALAAKVGGVGGVFEQSILTYQKVVENIKQVGLIARVYIPWIDLSADDYILLYDTTLLREYIEQPRLKPFTKQRQPDNFFLGDKTPVILIHGINRGENLKNICDIGVPWCYKYKKEVWDTFYRLASDDFFESFKVYEYIYPTYRSAEFSGQELATLITNNPELQDAPLYIVAHSMGGLVARYAMAYDESGQTDTGIAANVQQIYTIATPHHGSIGASLLYIDQGKFTEEYSSLGLSLGDYNAFAIATGAARGFYGLAAYTEGYISLLWDNYDDGLTDTWVNIGTRVNEELKLFNDNDPYKDKITVYAGGNILGGTLYDDGLRDEQMAIQAATVMATFGLYNPDDSSPNYFESDAMVPRSSALFASNNASPYLSEVTLGLFEDELDHQDVFRHEDFLNDIIEKMSDGVIPPDTTLPSTPTGFTATAVSSNQINISWDTSTDDIGVTGYNVYRDGAFLKSVTGTSTSDTELSPDIEYCYTVSAYDAVGNESGQSIEACATTQIPTDVSEIIRVSVASDGTQGNSHSGTPSISADGRYVAFRSSASNLVAGDTNGDDDIFVHDTQAGTTTRVSVASDGTQGNGNSGGPPSISADGRYVAFHSSASNLVAGDTNGTYDIFVHDTQTGATTRVSVASDGTQGNSHSYYSSISADGRYVAFRSNASNLVTDDTNEYRDIFVHDTQTGATTRVSIASDGAQGNGVSVSSSISADGRYVAFSSYATNLVAGDTNGDNDIFVHDTQTGATTLVSVASDGTQGGSGGSSPSISADGRYVAFSSYATNLVAGDTNGDNDIFVHDTQTGVTTRVSVASDGTQGNNGSAYPSISADGRYVAFRTYASSLVAGDTNGTYDIFVHDTQTGVTKRISVASDGTQGNGNSGSSPSISADGRYVAFSSNASNLVASDTNGSGDTFRAPNPLYISPFLLFDKR